MAKAARSTKKSVDSKRRLPTRANALNTVETIFEATARILQRDGLAALNTNRIAETAGVSIGALYGYFPNKDAILLAMARRELDALRDRVATALLAVDDEVHPVRRAIRALIKGYSVRNRARRILMETLFSRGGSEDMARPVSEIARLVAAQGARLYPEGAAAPSPVGLFVLTQAVDSVVRTATYENVPYLQSQEFEDELVRLVMGYLLLPPGSAKA